MDNNFTPNQNVNTSNTENTAQVTNQQTVQPNVTQQQYTQQQYTQQQPYNQQAYNQQTYDQQAYNQQTYDQQAYNQQMYNQQAYNQQAYNQQAYNQQAYNQQMYNQQAYGQQMYNQQPAKPARNINISGLFTGLFDEVSVFLLTTIIAAVLLIVTPFLNFASIHANQKIGDLDYLFRKGSIHVKVSDGMNMFELKKTHGTIKSVCKATGVSMDLVETGLELAEGEIDDLIEDETDINVKDGTIKEGLGIAYLCVKGGAPLALAPFMLIISGLLLLYGALKKNKIVKIVASSIPLVALLWLIICSKYFFSYMGIGVLALVLGSGLGFVGAFLDKE